jgi:hypothetical protein
VEGYRLRGRPRSRWKDNIKKDVESMGIKNKKNGNLETSGFGKRRMGTAVTGIWSLKPQPRVSK